MGLSKHSNNNSSLLEELKRLEENFIMPAGKEMKPSGCYRLSGNPPHVIYNTNCPDALKEQIEDILSKHQSKEADPGLFYTISFDADNIHYNGRLTPEFKHGKEQPSSWHVVLNEVFFGYLHKEADSWKVSEQRPAALTGKVGSMIDNKAYEPHTI